MHLRYGDRPFPKEGDTISPASLALEEAADYAFQLGETISKERLRWIIQTFLDAEDLT